MKKASVKSFIKAIIIVLIFWFVGYGLVINIKGIEWSKLNLNWPGLFLGLIFFMLYFLGIMNCWRLLVVGLGYPLDRKNSFRIWFYSNMGKYIPGKFWFILGRYEMCGKLGVPVLITTGSIFLEMILLILSGLLLFFFCQKWIIDLPFGTGIFGFIFLGGLIAIHPNFINFLFGLFCKLRKKEPLKIPMKYNKILVILFYYTIAWSFYGIGCWVTAKSMGLPSHFFAILGVFPLAWIIGYLSVITPGGLGVREGTSVLLLAGVMGNSYASILTIMVRILWTVAETLCFVLTRFVRKNS